MNLQENKIFTSDDDPQMLVNQLAFLTVMSRWNKGFELSTDVMEFDKQVDAMGPKAVAAFSANENTALVKLNNLVQKMNMPLKASVQPVKEMAYQKPNFEKVWDRVRQNGFISSLGFDKWLELAQSGKDSKISKPSMDKVLDYDPTIKAKDDLKYSSVNMPIILKSPMGDYHLLSGNAELNGIMDMHGNAKVWFVDGSQATV